jgi:hypothetical protein
MYRIYNRMRTTGIFRGSWREGISGLDLALSVVTEEAVMAISWFSTWPVVLIYINNSGNCTLTEIFLTLTEVFTCFSLNCNANARVKLANTGHGQHSSKLVVIWRWQVRATSYNSNKLTNQMQQFYKFITWLLFRSTCFGRLHAHHRELTTALTASGFTLERGGSSVVSRGLAGHFSWSAT